MTENTLRPAGNAPVPSSAPTRPTPNRITTVKIDTKCADRPSETNPTEMSKWQVPGTPAKKGR